MKKMKVEQFIVIKYLEYVMSLFRSKSKVPFNYVFASTRDALNIHTMITNYKFSKRRTLVDLLNSLLIEYEIFNDIDNILVENRVSHLKKWLFNENDETVKSIIEISPKMALLYYSSRFCQVNHEDLINSQSGNSTLRQICDNIYGKDTYKELDLMTVRYALFSEDNNTLLTYLSNDDTNYDKFIDRDSLTAFIVLHLLSIQCKVLWDIQCDTGSFEDCLRHVKECRYMYLKYIDHYNRYEKDRIAAKAQLQEVELATTKYKRILKTDHNNLLKMHNYADKRMTRTMRRKHNQ